MRIFVGGHQPLSGGCDEDEASDRSSDGPLERAGCAGRRPAVRIYVRLRQVFHQLSQSRPGPKSDQIIRLFANDTAVAAGQRGEDLPNGSVLVGEIYAGRKDGDVNVMTSRLGRRIRDKLVAIAVMEKQAGWGAQFPKELRNGDWDFAIFSRGGNPLDKDLNASRSCHAPLQETQHIFSLQHLVM
jgi:Cytochrome P460